LPCFFLPELCGTSLRGIAVKALNWKVRDGVRERHKEKPNRTMTQLFRYHGVLSEKGETMRKLLPTLLLFLLALPLFAQDKPAAQSSDNPVSKFNERGFERTKGILLRSADKMPEENYSFKPVDTVRSYGQIIGHLADAQYLFCSTAAGEKNPDLKIEQTKTSKADLIAALKDALAYCDKVYGGMTDATGTQMVKFFGNDIPKFGVLSINIGHNMEHYGNLVTYMRIKGIVPPTSEQQGSMPAQSKPAEPKK
jgi:uncharacterized damage-inducible protein DinB